MKRILLCLLLLPAVLLAQVDSRTAYRIRSGSSLPAACSVGELFQKSGASAGVYYCSSSNTWTIILGLASSIGSDTQVVFIDGTAFAGDTGMVFNKNTNTLTVTTISAGNLVSIPSASTVIGSDGNNFTSPVAGTDYTSPSSTETQTNKTINVEGTGNVITTLSYIPFRPGVCQNVTASLAFSTPAANAPAATCVTGTNTNYATADFDADTDESVQDHFPLPPDFTGTVDLRITWRAAATSGNVVWAVQTICVADAETGDPAFNTASTVTDAAKGTTLQFNTASITGVTITGCAASEELFFRFYRDANDGSDTMTGDAQLISLLFAMRRAQ